MARLVLLNGPPGIGKSTLSARYVERHPGALNLDIDTLAPLVGGPGRPGARRAPAARPGDGRGPPARRGDVVVPQFLSRTGEITAFEDVARDEGAAFREIVLLDSRGAGIDRASGEYLVFLDGDDTLHADDVLTGLDDDLRRTGEPDVLVFDYEQARPCGLGRRGNLRGVLDVDGPRPLRPDERAAALSLSWVCWNTAYRRDFVTRTGLRFPPGYYEDVAWTLRAVLAADRIGVSGRVGVDHRRCRPDSISRATSPRHLEVFDQFDRVLDFLHRHPELDSADVRTVLAGSAETFLRSRSERLRVVPVDLLPEFRRRSDALVTRMVDPAGSS